MRYEWNRQTSYAAERYLMSNQGFRVSGLGFRLSDEQSRHKLCVDC